MVDALRWLLLKCVGPNWHVWRAAQAHGGGLDARLQGALAEQQAAAIAELLQVERALNTPHLAAKLVAMPRRVLLALLRSPQLQVLSEDTVLAAIAT
jgi:hypothetical protein